MRPSGGRPDGLPAARRAGGARGAITITDLSSRNDTFVDEVRVRQACAGRGQCVRFGDHAFLVSMHDPSPEDVNSSVETDHAEAERRPSAAGPTAYALSDAQRRIFTLLVQGLAEKAIATRLRLSQHTIHNHVRAIYRTLHVHSRPELMAYVFQGRQTL